MFLVYVFTLILSGCTLAQRVVDTEYGQVRGHVINVNNGITQTTVDVFHGIPYAKDTSGARRFAVSTQTHQHCSIGDIVNLKSFCMDW